MLADPKMRPTELRMTPAAPHDEDSRATRSRSHTRTSVQQQRLPTVIRSARTVSQVTSNAARGRAQSRRACTSRGRIYQRASACDHSQSAVQTQSTLLENGLDQAPARGNLCTNPRHRTCCEQLWRRGQSFLKALRAGLPCCPISTGHARVRSASQPYLRLHVRKRSPRDRDADGITDRLCAVRCLLTPSRAESPHLCMRTSPFRQIVVMM